MKMLISLIGNPANGQLSHSKLWANIAAAVMTAKFLLNPDPSLDLWLAYGGMVGGYALIRRGVAAAQQVGEARAGCDGEAAEAGNNPKGDVP